MLTGHYGIEEVTELTGTEIVCGECFRAWVEDITPAGRCPFEDFHDEEV